MIEACPQCEARVLWAVEPTGKRTAFELAPSAKGNRILVLRGPGRLPVAVPLALVSEIDALGTVRYAIHRCAENPAG